MKKKTSFHRTPTPPAFPPTASTKILKSPTAAYKLPLYIQGDGGGALTGGGDDGFRK